MFPQMGGGWAELGCPETVAGSETIGTKQDQCEPDGIRVGGSRRRAGGRDGGQGWLLSQECKAGLTFENNSM